MAGRSSEFPPTQSGTRARTAESPTERRVIGRNRRTGADDVPTCGRRVAGRIGKARWRTTGRPSRRTCPDRRVGHDESSGAPKDAPLSERAMTPELDTALLHTTRMAAFVPIRSFVRDRFFFYPSVQRLRLSRTPRRHDRQLWRAGFRRLLDCGRRSRMKHHTSMPKTKVALTLDAELLERVDELVAKQRFRNRSQAIESALADKIHRLARTRLARESAKLNPREEKRLADEDLADALDSWPEY